MILGVCGSADGLTWTGITNPITPQGNVTFSFGTPTGGTIGYDVGHFCWGYDPLLQRPQDYLVDVGTVLRCIEL